MWDGSDVDGETVLTVFHGKNTQAQQNQNDQVKFVVRDRERQRLTERQRHESLHRTGGKTIFMSEDKDCGSIDFKKERQGENWED